MSKLQWKGSTLLAPVPAALVSCGTLEKPNALTIAWTGITCSNPPMTYISVCMLRMRTSAPWPTRELWRPFFR